MARLNLFAAFPIIGLLMCGIAHAEDKPATPPAVPPAAAPAPVPPAPVPPVANPAAPPPPKEHVMHADELLHQNGPQTEAERKAIHEEMRKKFEAMTPDQRKAFFEERRKEMQARIDAMTPEQREAFKKHMEEQRAQVLKEHPEMAGKHPEGPGGMMKPPMDGEHKPSTPPTAPNEKGQPPVGGQPSSDKH